MKMTNCTELQHQQHKQKVHMPRRSLSPSSEALKMLGLCYNIQEHTHIIARNMNLVLLELAEHKNLLQEQLEPPACVEGI